MGVTRPESAVILSEVSEGFILEIAPVPFGNLLWTEYTAGVLE